MKRLTVVAIATFILSASVGFVGWTLAIPWRAMSVAEERIAARLGGYNRTSHGAPRTHRHRGVVMPAPDLLYSACPYDLQAGDLLVDFEPPPDVYWSISFYAHNTDNYHTITAADAGAGPLRLRVRHGAPAETDDADLVLSTTRRGIVLLRIFMPDRSDYEALAESQRTADCRPVSGLDT